MTSSVRTGGLMFAVLSASVAVTLTGCSSAPSSAAHTPPTSAGHRTSGAAPQSRAATATATTVLAADPADYHVGSLGPGTPRRYDANTVSFQTPSHNIHCTAIDGDEIVCETVRHTFAAAPRPADCTHNWLGSDVTLDTRGATLGVCAGNPIVQSDSNVLPYGHRLTVGGVSCVSETAHLACTEGRHGFTLDRARAALR